MTSETNDDTHHLFERMNLTDFDPTLSAVDKICKNCTPKRFCENCLRNGILLSSFISDSDDYCNQRPTESNSYAPPLTNIYEYNLHLLAAVCMLGDENNDCEPRYRLSGLIPDPEDQCPTEKKTAAVTTTVTALHKQICHTSNHYDIIYHDESVLSSKENFGVFSQSKYQKLEMHHEIGSFSEAQGFCLSNNEDIIIVDRNNHRVKVFDKNGVFQFGLGRFGRKQGQLFYPHRVAAMSDGRIIVCDRGVRLQIFNRFGIFEKEILYLLSHGTKFHRYENLGAVIERMMNNENVFYKFSRNDDFFIAFTVTYDGKIVAMNSSSIVFIITEDGEILKSFCCNDFVIDAWHIVTNGPFIYICDFKGHGVVVFDHNGNYQRRIGNLKDTPYPTGIDVCDNGAILISCCRLNSYVIKSFTTTGTFISNFTLPNQMWRTTGLKITNDGLVITLDKSNNRALTMKAFTFNNFV